jgi:adenosylcobinamide kinase/adenosylcobinamide-phosphate guanylyltransferase
MRSVTYISGGSRSGKSSRALELARAFTGAKAFIATAQALDREMGERIARHRRERGDEFLTVEEPLDLAAALKRLPAGVEVAVVDCLTLWLSNLLFRHGDQMETCPEMEAFLAALDGPGCALILVSNEVGMGIVPADPLSRRFRDLAGRLNQRVAARADRVLFMVSGLPLVVKG